MIRVLLRSQWLLVATILLYGLAFLLNPEQASQALTSAATTFSSVLPLIIAVFCLVGLLHGPAYIIFLLLMEIQKRGARWAVITMVLTSYAVKLQLIPIEAGFLGWPFTLGRALITIALAIPTGLLVEAMMEKQQKL